MKLRDKREDTFLEARLNFEGRWQDVLIRNVSKRGIMVQCPMPPPRGAFVEIRRGGNAIVGHVRWQGDHCFGTKAQDIIDLGQLSDDTHRRKPPGPERRRALRLAADRRCSDMRTERETGRLVEYALLAGSLVLLAMLLAMTAGEVLADPARAAGDAMAAAAITE